MNARHNALGALLIWLGLGLLLGLAEWPYQLLSELGFLVQSFNEMTEALTNASEEAEHSRSQLQSQSEYLETVLGSDHPPARMIAARS